MPSMSQKLLKITIKIIIVSNVIYIYYTFYTIVVYTHYSRSVSRVEFVEKRIQFTCDGRQEKSLPLFSMIISIRIYVY